MTDKCDQCGKTDEGIGWFGAAYRRKELKNGRADPGNLCGACAGSVDGKRIGAEAARTVSVPCPTKDRS
jgi:hypothetical protein